MATNMEALAAGMNETIKRQDVVLEAYVQRIAELEAALAPFAALPTSTVEIEDTRVTVRVNKRDILAAGLALKR